MQQAGRSRHGPTIQFHAACRYSFAHRSPGAALVSPCATAAFIGVTGIGASVSAGAAIKGTAVTVGKEAADAAVDELVDYASGGYVPGLPTSATDLAEAGLKRLSRKQLKQQAENFLDSQLERQAKTHAAHAAGRQAAERVDDAVPVLSKVDNVACFVAGTPVAVVGGEGGKIWYATVGGVFAAAVGTFVVTETIHARRRKRKRKASRAMPRESRRSHDGPSVGSHSDVDSQHATAGTRTKCAQTDELSEFWGYTAGGLLDHRPEWEPPLGRAPAPLW